MCGHIYIAGGMWSSQGWGRLAGPCCHRTCSLEEAEAVAQYRKVWGDPVWHGRQLWGRQSAAVCLSERPRNTLAPRVKGNSRACLPYPLRFGWAGDGEGESVPARDTRTGTWGSQQGRKAADSTPKEQYAGRKACMKNFWNLSWKSHIIKEHFANSCWRWASPVLVLPVSF